MRFSLRAKRILTGAAAGALVLSMLPAGVASAGTEEVCEGAEDSGFPDKGTTHGDNIDCMAAYDVMQGRLDGSFGTFDDITRGATAAVLVNFATTAAPDLVVPTDDDPFTDKGDVFDTEINALWNLGLTDGTSATTYSPGEAITRGQFAKLLYEAHVALGIEFDASYPEAFPDAGTTFGDEINALAGEGIIEGYADGTFGTWDNISRGAVISLLAESAGVLDDTGNWNAPRLPGASNQTFTVSPSDAAAIEYNDVAAGDDGAADDDRTYTVTNTVAGETHTIALFPASSVSVGANGDVTFADSGDNGEADDIGMTDANLINVQNGNVAAGGAMATAIPVNGVITFTVDGVSTEQVVPVVFFDADSDGELDLNADNQPTDEVFGVGGMVTYYAPEAPTGAEIDGEVIFLVESSNHIVIDNTATGFEGEWSVFYGGGDDTYSYNPDGAGDFLISETQWEDYLSIDDVITEDAGYTEGGANDWTLVNDVPAAPTGLMVADSGDLDGDADNTDVQFSWDAALDGRIDSYTLGIDAFCDDGGTYTDVTANSTDTMETVNDLPNGDHCAVVTAFTESPATNSATSAELEFTVGPEGVDTTPPTSVYSAVTTDAGLPDVLDNGDVWSIKFDEAMDIAAGDIIRVRETGNQFLNVELGNGNTFSVNEFGGDVVGETAGDELVITWTSTPEPDGDDDGDTNNNVTSNRLDYPLTVNNQAGITDEAGNNWNLGAGDIVIEVDETAPNVSNVNAYESGDNTDNTVNETETFDVDFQTDEPGSYTIETSPAGNNNWSQRASGEVLTAGADVTHENITPPSVTATGGVTFDVRVTVTDNAGNSDAGSMGVDQLTVFDSTEDDDAGPAPVAPANLTVGWDDGPVINDTENDATTVSGTVDNCDGCTVDLQYQDSGSNVANDTATVSGTTFSDVQNIDGFADGIVTVTATVSNSEGSVVDTAAADHDGTPPTLNSTAIDDDPINLTNETDVDASGDVDDSVDDVSSSQIELLFTDDGGNEVDETATTYNVNGGWTAQNVDLSGLNDGTITLTVTVTDDAGNTDIDTATSTKDTVAPSPTGAFAPNAETVILTFDESIEASCASTEEVDFAYDPDITEGTVTPVQPTTFSCSGSEVTLTFAAGTVDPAASDDELIYDGQGSPTNDLRDVNGNPVADFDIAVVAGTP